ncbi:MAG: AI-2E family transporter [Chloroflexi bacterium]|nr:AI-2E family transporter [Chloroflexota bacterium]
MTSNGNRSARAQALEPLLPPIRVTPQQRNRLILVGLAAIVLLWLLNQSFAALGPFIFALVLAYLMLPLVDLLDRLLPRIAAILAVYVAFIGAVWALFAWLAPLVAGQADQLSEQLPSYSKQLQEATANITGWYNSLPISADVRQSIENSARSSLSAVGSAIQASIVGILSVIARAMGFVVGLLIIPFWLFYVLKDKDRGINAFNKMLPMAWRTDIWRMLRIINGVLSSYIRGQIILALAVGTASTIGMVVVGAPYPLLLGIISGLTEVVPVVGPILGAVPGLAVASFSQEGWVLVLKVLLVYIVVQQLENNLLVPKIQGDSVNLHPAIIMVALVVGSQVAGIVGLIAAVPVAAILRDVYLYLYRRFTEGDSPHEAEASLASRHDDESAKGRKKEAAKLAVERQQPGINSEDEIIADLDRSARSDVAAAEK